MDGLEGFCNAWETAATTLAFQQSQLAILGGMYLGPALQLAQTAANLQSTCSIGQIYDSVIQIGLKATQDLILSFEPPEHPADASTEYKWLSAFLDARTSKLQSMGPVYAATVTRIASYSYLLAHTQESDWKSGSITALNNDGTVVSLKCDPNFTMPAFSMQAQLPAYSNPQEYSSAPDLWEVVGGALLWHIVFLVLFVVLY